MSILAEPHFHDPEKAREYLEALRWPDGPACPHCGEAERVYRLEGKGGAKGKKGRPGLLKCASCRKQFSVTVGTVFERSKVPLHKWLLAVHLLTSSKKGISSHQLHRTLGVTYKTAWFMSHRIREAMREPFGGKLGGEGSIFEADDTYIGGKEQNRHRNAGPPKKADARGRMRRYYRKERVLTLVERDGRVRSWHVPTVNVYNVRPLIWGTAHQHSTLMTDEAGYFTRVGRGFRRHGTVNHSIGEYVRGNVHTNTVEGYFGILKRGLGGIYQHVSPQHLKRYVGEFDFRYNHRKVSDRERTDAALRGIEGKRLTYHQAGSEAH